MDIGTSSQTSKRKDKRTDTHKRRVWSPNEEVALIIGLKDAIANGWKCENGFRTCYLLFLKKHITTSFPGTDLRGDPHIHSKIHIWKKTHAFLVSMLARSGFGQNDRTNMIVVEDAVWDNYVKVRIYFELDLK